MISSLLLIALHRTSVEPSAVVSPAPERAHRTDEHGQQQPSRTQVRTPRMRLQGNSIEYVPRALKAISPPREPGYLSARAPWPGALPTSVADLPQTPVVRARIAEFGGEDSVNRMLKFLSEMRSCVGTAGITHAGAVAYEQAIVFDEAMGVTRPQAPILLDSSLDERDDLPVLECMTKLLTIDRTMRDDDRALLAKGTKQYVERWDVWIPIETDAFYPWIFGRDDLLD